MKRKYLIILACLLTISAYYLINRNNIPEIIEENNPLKTQIIVYTPQDKDYDKKDGECWTISTALQGRPNTFRCFVGHNIYDPCFNIEDKVICDTSPVKDGDEFELVYEGDLPENKPDYNENKAFSWVYQLEDGSYCHLLTGAAGTLDTGEFMYYPCDDNKVIIGYVDKSNDLWKAEVGYLREGSVELIDREIQTVVAAWE